MESIMKWHKRFLGLADHVSSWSRDPSTHVGAVVVRPDRTVASVGFNGFPRGVSDDTDRYSNREVKYRFICHAEANALMSSHERMAGYTLYASPLHPCNECAKLIIQSGIKSVVTRPAMDPRWKDSFSIASQMFKEAQIEVIEIAQDH